MEGDVNRQEEQASGGEGANEAWQDIYWKYCKDDSAKLQIEEEVSTETTWKELDHLDEHRELAARMMEQRTPEMPADESGVAIILAFLHQVNCDTSQV